VKRGRKERKQGASRQSVSQSVSHEGQCLELIEIHNGSTENSM
jgi:hypothetical protein